MPDCSLLWYDPFREEPDPFLPRDDPFNSTVNLLPNSYLILIYYLLMMQKNVS